MDANVDCAVRWIILLVPLLLVVPLATAEPILIDDFEQGLATNWEEKRFFGRTQYRVVADDTGGFCLEAASDASASGLVYPLDLDPRQWPILRWRWKIADTVPGGDARYKATDDYAARVYVVFPHWFFPRTRTLNYIWANRLPQGAAVPSPYTANSIMIAVQSGRGRRGEWVNEQQHVVDDYRRLFGEEPPRIGAVVIMTDSDNTGTQARAWYDDLTLGPDDRRLSAP